MASCNMFVAKHCRHCFSEFPQFCVFCADYLPLVLTKPPSPKLLLPFPYPKAIPRLD